MTPEDEEFARIEAEINRRQGDASQPAPVQEPIYQMQMMDGKWIDQAKQSYEYNKAHGNTVRIVYTTPPAAQPAPVQEPVAKVYRHGESSNGTPWHGIKWLDEGVNMPDGTLLYAAPQPVPVKTYHDGKPWPVAPKPWVGLSEDEINKLRHLVDWTAEWSYGRFAYELERLLREKNGGAA
jgi:hypothetical protein